MALVIPEIFANAINDKMRLNLKAGTMAFDATELVGEIRQAGDTIVFPFLNRIQDATELTDNVEIEPERISMDELRATIKEMGQAVRVLDKEEIQIKGGAMDKLVVQLAQSMAKAVDKSLIDSMDAEAVYKVATSGADSITVTELNAAIAKLGDQIDSDTFSGWLINSRLVDSFMNMDAFVSTAKTFAHEGNGVIKDGIIGYLYNVPVKVSNNNTFDEATGECKTYLIKNEALSYVFQKDITVEEERKAKLRATDIVTTALFATKVLDPKGIVILRHTIA